MIKLKSIKELGASINLKNGYIEAKADKLIGADIVFEGVTVTGTENIMMAACLAEGITTLKNVAMEPEISDLADLLNKMGAKVQGAGTEMITIEGVKSLHSAIYSIPADRIEAGTYLVAAALTGGEIKINSIQPERLHIVIERLKLAGATINSDKNSISLSMKSKRPLPVDISTSPFPGFPTDMQAQFSVLNALADGNSVVQENVFENRFMHIQELNRMGCNISTQGNQASIIGVRQISGAQVMATDLRASASLILAGLVASGETIVDRIYHIDRGYERIEEKLSYLGADITRLPG
jgi:UDP-N-acetylglucosamine 1-carboxyvinyltransferase